MKIKELLQNIFILGIAILVLLIVLNLLDPFPQAGHQGNFYKKFELYESGQSTDLYSIGIFSVYANEILSIENIKTIKYDKNYLYFFYKNNISKTLTGLKSDFTAEIYCYSEKPAKDPYEELTEIVNDNYEKYCIDQIECCFIKLENFYYM